MRTRRAAMAAVVSLLLAGCAATATAPQAEATGYGPGKVLFRFQSKEIRESSGVVASSYQDGLFFTHNDSGDRGRFFAVDARGCVTRTFELRGKDPGVFATESDVEDIARGPLAGRSSVWLADIGDNLHQREEITVLRVDEPRVPASPATGACGPGSTEEIAVTTYRLAYPDYPHDAETLLADPKDGRLYIVTKTPLGQSSVYAAPVTMKADALNTLELVAAFAFPPSATYDREAATEVANATDSSRAPYTQAGFDLIGRLSAVGGDVAPDRSRVVVRTYTDAFEWAIPAGTALGEVFTSSPMAIPLLYQRQGEAVAYSRDGRSLLTTCEDIGCAVHLYAG